MALIKICPTCGQHNLPISPFCSNSDCGVSLVAVPTSEPSTKNTESLNLDVPELTTIICPDCKAENVCGVARCVYCDFSICSDDISESSFRVELIWPWGKEIMTLPLSIGRESPSPDSIVNAIATHGYDNISRSHAKILWNVEKKEVSITDLGSSNGTFIDGVRIPSNQPIPIKNGVLVRFAANLSVVISFIRN